MVSNEFLKMTRNLLKYVKSIHKVNIIKCKIMINGRILSPGKNVTFLFFRAISVVFIISTIT